MSINLKKSVWILILSFCCIFLPESVASEGAASDKMAEHMRSEEVKEDYMSVERERYGRRYLSVYIDNDSCIQIDILFIFCGVLLLFVVVLEKTQ